MEMVENSLIKDNSFALLSDYLAPQERDRLQAILESALARPQGNLGMQDYQNWAGLVRPIIIQELNDSKSFFAFRNLTEQFNLDSFLQQYYQDLVSRQ